MAKRHWNRSGDLESLFLRLEELVLANSGEDEFDEIFKLLVAKLRDERSEGARRFRAWADERQTARAITTLLAEAEQCWPGILDGDTQPRLTPEHLQICVEALAVHTISATNLEVLDGFFEFLVARTAKGAKGQYFTPRHVVELCVRLLAPTKDDTIVDPACGSGGFLLHALAYVRDREELAGESLRRYCERRLWGFDISRRALKVARALMLLAGDGRANLARVNSLVRPDTGGLFSVGRDASIDEAGLHTIEDTYRIRRHRQTGFDVVLTNPPFAGEVRERPLLESYALGRGRARVERDILFVERCLDLLRPGGRLAIILPHNTLAGPAARYAREWLLRRARVLGVIGLGRNTFLPHTHQKASVLVAQRRLTDDAEEQDERIFFAVSEQAGKNSKGQLVRRLGSVDGGPLWERVDHDFDDVVSAFRTFVAGDAGGRETR